jgi:SAM-dependent methyltransferase
MQDVITQYLKEELDGQEDEDKVLQLMKRAELYRPIIDVNPGIDNDESIIYERCLAAMTKAAAKYYNEIAPEYAAFRAGAWESSYNTLVKFTEKMAIERPKLVVDNGCGIGIDANFLAMLFPGTHVLGIDISSEMLKIAKEKAKRRGLTNIEYVEGSYDAMPVNDGSVDFVYFDGSIEFDDRFFPENVDLPCFKVQDYVFEKWATEIHRILRDGGLLSYAICTKLFKTDSVGMGGILRMQMELQDATDYTEHFEGKGFGDLDIDILDGKAGEGIVNFRKI